MVGKIHEAIPQRYPHRTFPADAAPMYERISKDLGWTPDAGQLSKMQTTNKKKLEEIEEKISDAEENLGDIEVRDAHR